MLAKIFHSWQKGMGDKDEWEGNDPLAYIETDRALAFTFASAEFPLDMFGMAHSVPLEKKDTSTLESKLFNVETGQKQTRAYASAKELFDEPDAEPEHKNAK